MREVSSGMEIGLAAKNSQPVWFVAGDFESGMLRMWSGLGTIEWDGHTWTGAGALGTISAIRENEELRADGIELGLSGIPSELIGLVLDDARQGRPVTVWFGLLDEDNEVVADPLVAFSGELDVPTIDHDGETTRVTITVENRLIMLERASGRRWTDEDQQARYPGDRGFEFASSEAVRMPKVPFSGSVWLWLHHSGGYFRP